MNEKKLEYAKILFRLNSENWIVCWDFNNSFITRRLFVDLHKNKVDRIFLLFW